MSTMYPATRSYSAGFCVGRMLLTSGGGDDQTVFRIKRGVGVDRILGLVSAEKLLKYWIGSSVAEKTGVERP